MTSTQCEAGGTFCHPAPHFHNSNNWYLLSCFLLCVWFLSVLWLLIVMREKGFDIKLPSDAPVIGCPLEKWIGSLKPRHINSMFTFNTPILYMYWYFKICVLTFNNIPKSTYIDYQEAPWHVGHPDNCPACPCDKTALLDRCTKFRGFNNLSR